MQIQKLLAGLALLFFTNYSLAAVTIVQFVEVGPLNDNKNGIIEVLEKNNIPYKYYNAQGQTTLAKQIFNKVMSDESDVVVTITTPVTLMAIASRLDATQPIVFSAVSDPFNSKIIKEDNYLKTYITGSTDNPPVEKTLEVIEGLFQPKKIGFLYCNSEPNSISTLRELKKMAHTKYQIIEAPVTNSGMVKSAVEHLVDQVDVVYVPLDSTVLSSLELATRLLSRHDIPVIANDPQTLSKGVTAAVGFNEYEVGKEAGAKIVRILHAKNNGDSLEDLRITSPTKYDIIINKRMINHFNLNVPTHMAQYVGK
jgi:putative ABC transport system substrate-binding protein